MAVLRPHALGLLARRMLRELAEGDSAFDLPRRRFFTGAERDLAVRFHGREASTPFGPAAGPQSQMAQNLVLSFLGGARIMELKTVQRDDRLVIPRPCIDMQTVGYNVEWSQELRLEESLEEYVKGAMLVRILLASGELPLAPEHARVLWDMSVGYDLAGIRAPGVRAFVEGMLDCTAIVDRLRRDLTGELRRYRDLDFPARLSGTLTLSTFHGCPPDEIERIVEHLQDEHGLHCIVKLNPMLLGPEETRRLLAEMGYDEIRVPDTAFERDARWEQAIGLVERLRARAAARGLGFGVKLTNTLIVANHRDFFDAAQREMYLSGPPLHVLAMRLVARFRERFGAGLPISFSAGIDRANFPDAVALGLVPVTVCSDLLKPGGYGRAAAYLAELARRMGEVRAHDVADFLVRAHGHGRDALGDLALAAEDPRRAACLAALEGGEPLEAAAGPELHRRWVAAAVLRNTARYAREVAESPRYRREANAKTPRKIGSRLELFDCITCDKCVPVCPNDANFTFELPPRSVPVVKLSGREGSWTKHVEGELAVLERHQIANFADFCNDCGNCDVFCPEDGGPYLVKPRFFGSIEDWRGTDLDGFCHESGADGAWVLHARIGGRELALGAADGGGRLCFSGQGFALRLDPESPADDPRGTADVEVDLTWFHVLCWIRSGVYGAGAPTSYPALLASGRE